MNLGYPLGAASQALPSLRPGERLLWAAYGRTLNYDVRGLDPWGVPKKSVLGKLGSGAANFAGDMVGAALGGGDDSGRSNPPSPQVIVFGEQGGLAHAAVRELSTSGSLSRLWALTSARLLVLEKSVAPGKPSEKSFLSKAIGFGKDIAAIMTTKTYGENAAGVPIARHEMVPCAEIPRESIAGFAVAEHGKKRRPCLRASFVDGSGMDFLFDCDDPRQFAWLHSVTVS
ncbi:hypothetical protein [Amycolatopsis keratiniphila]|uniref:Uncharacterized protein n=1 Tax=Amycolatopsis keratiniphila subsp. keratiniphila TaxID=227715 RepID=A0A1W2LR85_9PSEU|nr:hypothetical protein [Amycolatopsis keratiniphila]ONF66849.1 hypothetical protein AVR91_0223070 [Amycolatopsis keratiniphila subsp. keratiniphila]